MTFEEFYDGVIDLLVKVLGMDFSDDAKVDGWYQMLSDVDASDAKVGAANWIKTPHHDAAGKRQLYPFPADIRSESEKARRVRQMQHNAHHGGHGSAIQERSYLCCFCLDSGLVDIVASHERYYEHTGAECPFFTVAGNRLFRKSNGEPRVIAVACSECANGMTKHKPAPNADAEKTQHAYPLFAAWMVTASEWQMQHIDNPERPELANWQQPGRPAYTPKGHQTVQQQLMY